MIKKSSALILVILLFFAFSSIGSAQETEPAVQIPNPWRNVPAEEVKSIWPGSFAVPEGAENISWSVLDPGTDLSGALVQLSFDLDGMHFTAREQRTGTESADLSGMFYEWTVTDDLLLRNWNGRDLSGTYLRCIGENEYADVCLWYDPVSRVSYSLGVTARDLDGFDLQAVAEALNPVRSADAVTEAAYDPAAYEAAAGAVRAEYVRIIQAGSDALENYDEAEHPELPWYTAVLLRYSDLQYYEGYYDFDGNGVPEMMIASGNDSYMELLAIYTFDGQKMHYLCKEYPLGERSRLKRADDQFVLQGSGGASSGILVIFRIAEDGWGTDILDVVEYNYSETGQVTYTPSLGNITPEEITNRALAEYEPFTDDFEWTSFYPGTGA